MAKRIKTEFGSSSPSGKSNEMDVDKFDKEPPDFYCKICASQTNSAFTWHMHVTGKRHQKKKATLIQEKRRFKPAPDADVRVLKISGGPFYVKTKPSKKEAFIQSKFDEILHAPCVGLEYVTEIWRKIPSSEPVYHCKLCDADCQLITVVNHVNGYRHRLAYIKTIDADRYLTLASSLNKQSALSDKACEIVKEMERINGRKQVCVEVEVGVENESDEADDMDRPGPSNYKPPSPTSGLNAATAADQDSLKPPPVDLIFKTTPRDDRTKVLEKFPTEKIVGKCDKNVRHKMCEEYFKSILEDMSGEEKIKVAHQLMQKDFSFLQKFDEDLHGRNSVPISFCLPD